MIYQVEIEWPKKITEHRTVKMRKVTTAGGVWRQMEKLTNDIYAEDDSDKILGVVVQVAPGQGVFRHS